MIAVEIVGYFYIEDTQGSLYLAEQSHKIIHYLTGQLCIVIYYLTNFNDTQLLMEDDLTQKTTLNRTQQA